MNTPAIGIINWAIRPLLFGVLWAFMLFSVERHLLSYSLLICAISFVFFFFIPVADRAFLLYSAASLIMVPLVAMGVEPGAVWGVLAFLMIDASLRLGNRSFIVHLTLLLAVIGVTGLLGGNVDVLNVLLFAGAGLLAVLTNRFRNERAEFRQMYDGLLDEYRKMKREHSENERIARLEERTRIAHDIHDSVGHQLTALLMQLEMKSIEHGPDRYEGLKEMAKQSLEETRLAVKTLKYDAVSGIESVLQLIRKLESEHALSVKFTTKQGVLRTRLSNDQSVVLYRSIQEALTNAMKHGDTRDVSVTIGRTALGELNWIVSNGISRQLHVEEGFGLTAMRERLDSVGGKLRVYQTEKEFTVEGTMPIGGT